MSLSKILLGLTIALSASASFDVAHAATPSGVIVMAKSIEDIISLDPAEAYEVSGVEVDANLYDRLVALDFKNGNAIIPGLAASWDISADDMTYTFHLRKDVKFHSGNPLTSADVVYSFQRLVALNKTPAFILTQFGFTKDNIATNVVATDDYTVTVKVAKPFAPSFFLNCLTSTMSNIVDSKLVKQHEKDGDWGNAWLKANSAGSGAYKLRNYTPNQQVILDANEAWYRGAPKNKRVIIQHVLEAGSQRLLLEKGDVDLARNLSKDQLQGISQNPDVRVVRGDKGQLIYLSLNQKNQNLAKPEVWEALKYLVDYSSIEKNVLAGTYKQHQAFIPSGFPGAINDNPYKLDVDKAKELLASAGLKDGFSTSIDVRSGSPWSDIAQALQASFALANVHVQINTQDARTVLTRFRSRNHDIYLGAWGSDYLDPNSNAEGFASNLNNADDTTDSKTVAWRNAWAIPELTKQTQAAALEPDAAKRAALYEQEQRDVLKSSPYVVMFQTVETIAERSNVSGWEFGPGTSSTNFYASITKN